MLKTFSDYLGKYDVIIVGGGPVGSYTASILSNLGLSVTLMEEHYVSGHPTQCAGLVNTATAKLPIIEDIIGKAVLSEIKGADIHSPSGHRLSIRSKDIKALTIDRGIFDRSLMENASRSGSEICMGCKVTDIERDDGTWLVIAKGINGSKKINGDLVILCDGSNHYLRRTLDINIPREIIPGINCEVAIDNGSNDCSGDIVGIFTGSKTAPGFFSWAIPCNKYSTLRIGLAALKGYNIRTLLNGLMIDHRLLDWLNMKNQSSNIGFLKINYGTISLGPIDPCPQKGILMLGDAAGMTKPTSGGGIFPGLLSACLLGESIKRYDGIPTDEALKDFSKAWFRDMGKEIKRSMLLRKMIRDIKDREIDESLYRISKSRAMEIVNNEGDIDHPFTLAVSALKKDPSLISLVPRFIPYLTSIYRT